MNTGAFGEGFPYTNFHDLNMDWIIKIAKDFLDQYTHIQEIIEQGKTDIQDLTTSGLEQLQEKADNLEELLQAWYNEHSEDIANQLADALADLNAWYNEHSEDIANQLTSAIGTLSQTLTTTIATFQREADEIAEETRQSIPSDYTSLYDQVQENEENVVKGFLETFEHTGTNWDQQGISDDGSIVNLTNWTCLYKTTPHHFDSPFTFQCLSSNNDHLFHIIEYEKIGTDYVWKQGRAIRSRDKIINFPAGYYKLAFQDSTWTYDFYHMTPANRNSTVDPLYSLKMQPVSANRFASIDNAFAQAFELGYTTEYKFPGSWEQQGIDNTGAIINLTKWSCMYKTIAPMYVKTNFVFFNNAFNSNFKFHVLEYNKTENGYTFKKGTTIDYQTYQEFTAGYYKLSFEDNSWTFDLYNMDGTQRTRFINNLYAIYTNGMVSRVERTVNILTSKEFEKPTIICAFDWYSDSWQKYQIMKGTYGLDATFCLDHQTTTYNLDAGLTREQFDTMLANGWDFALYGGVGGNMSQDNPTLEGWQTALEGILAQKEAMGIYNPVMYNTPANNNSSVITQACKNTGFLMQRAFNSDTGNYFLKPTQYKTGCFYLTTAYLELCKSNVEYAISHNCGAVFYSHNMSPSSDLSVEAFTSFCQYLKGKVDNGDIEVLSARQFAYKYLKNESMQNDYEAMIKMQRFLHQ